MIGTVPSGVSVVNTVSIFGHGDWQSRESGTSRDGDEFVPRECRHPSGRHVRMNTRVHLSLRRDHAPVLTRTADPWRLQLRTRLRMWMPERRPV
ncbi:hypothetical protein NOGI109294_01880 [Nocardiopsis gilva]